MERIRCFHRMKSVTKENNLIMNYKYWRLEASLNYFQRDSYMYCWIWSHKYLSLSTPQKILIYKYKEKFYVQYLKYLKYTRSRMSYWNYKVKQQTIYPLSFSAIYKYNLLLAASLRSCVLPLWFLMRLL